MTLRSCTACGSGPIRQLRVGHIAIGRTEVTVVVVVVVGQIRREKKRKVTIKILLWTRWTRDFSYFSYSLLWTSLFNFFFKQSTLISIIHA
jgi:hypothetical protein